VAVPTHQLVDQRDQRLKVFFNGQMEDISVLDVDGNCRRSDIVVERGTLIFLLFMISPTSSMVKRRPSWEPDPTLEKPPRNPQSRIEKD
jgi:hypothetical protein